MTSDLSSQEAEAILRQLAEAGPLTNHPKRPAVTAVAVEENACHAELTSARWAEARYRVLVEQIPAITFMAALDGGDNELYVSPHIEKMLGYSQKEWLEDPVLWYTRLHPDDRERWHAEFARTCASGEHFCSEYRFLARDGRVVWVHGEAQMVRDEQGLPLFLQGIAFDITLLKEAEATLRRTQNELEDLVAQRTAELNQAVTSKEMSMSRTQAVLDLALDCIVTADHEGKILEFNPAAEKTFGFRREEAIGRKLSELIIPPALRDAHERGIRHYLATGEGPVLGKRIEITAQRADGSEFPAELAIDAIRQGGRPMFTGYVRDLTESKKAEQGLARARDEKIMAEAASRAKNDFLSRMSHELRTPLNAILGFGQLLEMNPLTDDQRECVEQISRGGKHLLGLINEVLDISRIEAGQMDFSPEPVRVAEAFLEVLDLVRPLGVRRHIRVHADLTGADGHHVLADNRKLKQVLLNLVSNAVKYNREGGEVRLSCETATPDRLALVVTDTGLGIPPESMSRLFVPFDRLGAEQTGEEGAGLGLALSKSLVELMGGTLTATSVVGEGSQFRVELTRTPAPAALIIAECQDGAEAANRDKCSVLYVEDNLGNVRLMERILAHREHVQLLTAMQGRLGIELAKQHRPDLILLDVHLPDLNGEQVLRRLRADPETQHIPVVVVSADATTRQIERLHSAGALDYLIKPIDVAQLLRVMDQVLDNK